MRKKIPNSEQPSMRAASDRSSGRVRKNWRRRKMLKALPNQAGTHSGRNVPSHWPEPVFAHPAEDGEHRDHGDGEGDHHGGQHQGEQGRRARGTRSRAKPYATSGAGQGGAGHAQHRDDQRVPGEQRELHLLVVDDRRRNSRVGAAGEGRSGSSSWVCSRGLRLVDTIQTSGSRNARADAEQGGMMTATRRLALRRETAATACAPAFCCWRPGPYHPPW